jgi:hypothetical protein
MPPEGWRERHDARDLKIAVAELAYAEAEILRAEERLRVAAPTTDDWETIYEWAKTGYPDTAGPLELLAILGVARRVRDKRVAEYEAILIRWHDEDR